MTAIEDHLPLSNQQLLWCAPGSSGAFSPRFVITMALRITGHIDVAALQGALDDVVARHEALRTIVVRDAEPPYQQVYPPMPVSLTVRDLPATDSRRQVAEEQLAEADGASLELDQLPFLRAILSRFDSTDSTLCLVSHHLACDGWSMNLVMRDLAECYAARASGHPVELVRVTQYQDYIRWQLENRLQPASVANMAYWQEELDGAHTFTLPTDRPIPAAFTAAYVRHPFVIDGDVTAAITRFAKAERFSVFTVVLAAFMVLAHRIRGTLDPAVSTMFHGRSEPQFKGTVGVFLNFLTMRTDLANCQSFRDILLSTRAACLQAYEHEAPYQQVLEAIPSLSEPMADPSNCYLVFGYWDLSMTKATTRAVQIGDSGAIIRRVTRDSETLPGGVTWYYGMAMSGELSGGVQYSPEIFDDHTVAGWVTDYNQILAAAMADPGREWRQL
ncbi:MAG: condensation domain-containing protein [Jatrophihabitans sp.]